MLVSRAGVARAVHNDHHHDYDHDRSPRDFCPPARLGPYRASAVTRPDPLTGFHAGADPDRPLGPCRLCGTSSWLADERGAVHRCCARAEDLGERECLACRASWAAADRRARHEITRGAVAGDDRAGGRA